MSPPPGSGPPQFGATHRAGGLAESAAPPGIQPRVHAAQLLAVMEVRGLTTPFDPATVAPALDEAQVETVELVAETVAIAEALRAARSARTQTFGPRRVTPAKGDPSSRRPGQGDRPSPDSPFRCDGCSAGS